MSSKCQNGGHIDATGKPEKFSEQGKSDLGSCQDGWLRSMEEVTMHQVLNSFRSPVQLRTEWLSTY
jgi:hypothetical protein